MPLRFRGESIWPVGWNSSVISELGMGKRVELGGEKEGAWLAIVGIGGGRKGGLRGG